MHIEFCLKVLYSIIGRKNFWIYGSHIPRKCIDLRHFWSFPTQNLPSNFCHQILGRRKLLVTPGSILSKMCFSQRQKGVEKTMICFIKIHSENMKMTWNIMFFMYRMICSFFKSNVMALQFCN